MDGRSKSEGGGGVINFISPESSWNIFARKKRIPPMKEEEEEINLNFANNWLFVSISSVLENKLQQNGTINTLTAASLIFGYFLFRGEDIPQDVTKLLNFERKILKRSIQC